MRAAILVSALAAVTALALPAAALAGSGTQRDRGGVAKKVSKRFHLTKKERRALDLASIKVTGKEGLGVYVDATFKGNVERAIGRGHLKRGAIALILHPKSRRAKAAVIASLGPANAQRVLRRTRSPRVAALRTGRHVRFALLGDGFSGVKSVEVKALPRAPGRARRAATAAGDPGEVPGMTDGEAEEYVTVDELTADLVVLTNALQRLDPDDLDCDELEDLYDDLEDLLDDLREVSGRLDEAEAEIRTQLNDMNLPGDERRALIDELAKIHTARLLMGFMAIGINSLLDEVDEILDEDCPPPPALRLAMAWVLFSPIEVASDDARFTGSGGPITGIRVVVPDSGGMQRQITNFLCPSQLPNGQVSGNTLECIGANAIMIGDTFRVHLQTSPPPTSGMGGQLFGRQGGSFKGPFDITGP
jgi:hypothetical protein